MASRITDGIERPATRARYDQGYVLWRHEGRSHRQPVRELPEPLSSWQLSRKRATYDAIEAAREIDFDPAHLPVVATWNTDSRVPNLANKGVGLTPRDDLLPRYLGRLESVVEQIASLPSESIAESRSLRVAAARELYDHPEHIDWRRLGLLEIFEGRTYRNLTSRPEASILWTGKAPRYLSYQVDVIAEILTEDDPRYRFSWAMRRLFEHEHFHVPQTRFPFAYCFWVVGVHDKTPRSRPPASQGQGDAR